MNFVHTFIYEIQDPKAPFRYYYVENYLEGKYNKFTNNAGWVDLSRSETSLITQALSHYSW